MSEALPSFIKPMPLEQVRELVLALVSNYPLPADKGEIKLDDIDGRVRANYRLGPMMVRLEVDITQEPDGRFTRKFSAHTFADLLSNSSALLELLEGDQ